MPNLLQEQNESDEAAVHYTMGAGLETMRRPSSGLRASLRSALHPGLRKPGPTTALELVALLGAGQGCCIPDLASRACELWLEHDSSGKRKLLDILLSNCTFDGTSLTATHTEPFCWLAEGLACSAWLPLLDNLRNWLASEECRELAAGNWRPRSEASSAPL